MSRNRELIERIEKIRKMQEKARKGARQATDQADELEEILAVSRAEHGTDARSKADLARHYVSISRLLVRGRCAFIGNTSSVRRWPSPRRGLYRRRYAVDRRHGQYVEHECQTLWRLFLACGQRFGHRGRRGIANYFHTSLALSLALPQMRGT